MNAPDANRLVWVPATFWDDHEDRCRGDQPVATVVRRSGRRILIDGSAAELENLLSDALFYADKWGPDECPPGLKRSAAATVRALVAAGCRAGELPQVAS